MELTECIKENIIKRDDEKYKQIYWLAKMVAVKRQIILYGLLNKNWENAYTLKDCETCFAFAWCDIQRDANEFKEPKHIQDCVDKIIEMSIVNFLADPQFSEEQISEVILNDIHKFKTVYENWERWKNGISTS